MPAYSDWSQYDECVLKEAPLAPESTGPLPGTPAAEAAYNAALRDEIAELKIKIGVYETRDALRCILKDIKQAARGRSRLLHARIARKLAREVAGRRQAELELKGGQFVTWTRPHIPRAAILDFLDNE